MVKAKKLFNFDYKSDKKKWDRKWKKSMKDLRETSRRYDKWLNGELSGIKRRLDRIERKMGITK